MDNIIASSHNGMGNSQRDIDKSVSKLEVVLGNYRRCTVCVKVFSGARDNSSRKGGMVIAPAILAR